MAYNEKQLKCKIVDYILRNYHPQLIGLEVPFFGGRRWADVLLITGDNKLIAFEIKSDFDSFRRIKAQLPDYAKTFDQTYLMLSPKFCQKKTLASLPGYIGIGTFSRDSGVPQMLRKAPMEDRLAKTHLSYFLWNEDLSEYRKNKRETVTKIRARLKRYVSIRDLRKSAIRVLLKRYKTRYSRFLSEKSVKTQVEDLVWLTRSLGEIS